MKLWQAKILVRLKIWKSAEDGHPIFLSNGECVGTKHKVLWFWEER